MSRSMRLVVLGSALLLAQLGIPAHAQSPAQWQSEQIAASDKSERIMREANKHRGLLAQYQVMRYAYAADKQPAFRLIFGQYLSWYQTFIGDYPDAAASFSIRQAPLKDDYPSPLTDPRWHARPALEAIPELASKYQLVYLNEAHNIPLTRTLTVQLLGKLRQEGFDYFAVETIYQTDTKLQSRGYPTSKSGFYTEEPISAEMVRTALKLGFKVLGYEALSDATGDAREAEQARNIYNSVFKKDPHARLVVEAGYAHVQKSGGFLGGSSMAEHLFKLSRINGLSVEQTMLIPHPVKSDDHPDYSAIIEQLHPTTPIVFVDDAGKPWSLRPGYDVSVVFPPQKMRRGRPTWLSIGDLRQPFFVSGDRCEHHYPCMVEARYANEGPDAIPADRMVLDPVPLNATINDRVRQGQGAPIGELYLRPGRYNLTIDNENDDQIFAQKIDVPAEDKGSPKPGQP
ncbi:hypothetical protein B0E47_14750 [Rhodanobacter sp. B05]|uniref:hypothetical protein n=1 Tax=Rhodanobacter sp. B05 TaxID=1945859 RepID=UPI00098548CB|nr:hypothetical protein [Rhodanobacter sp. B05]OOG52558.1 hypothetical protein B0E47_14750 [Rhodanobacter sp. B05]